MSCRLGLEACSNAASSGTWCWVKFLAEMCNLACQCLSLFHAPEVCTVTDGQLYCLFMNLHLKSSSDTPAVVRNLCIRSSSISGGTDCTVIAAVISESPFVTRNLKRYAQVPPSPNDCGIYLCASILAAGAAPGARPWYYRACTGAWAAGCIQTGR